jgi:hypothetical protein
MEGGAAVLHVHRPHAPHVHVHPGFDEHPWRMLPVALSTVMLLTVLLIVACFTIAKAVTGHAY